MSQRAGKQTISIRKHSHSKGRNGSGSESRDKMARDLLTPDEIGRINGNDALLFIAGQHVYKDSKYRVPDHPNAKFLANDHYDENWYVYKRYKDDVEELLDKVNPENIIHQGTVSDEAS